MHNLHVSGAIVPQHLLRHVRNMSMVYYSRHVVKLNQYTEGDHHSFVAENSSSIFNPTHIHDHVSSHRVSCCICQFSPACEHVRAMQACVALMQQTICVLEL